MKKINLPKIDHKFDHTNPLDGSILIAIVLGIIYVLFPEYTGLIIYIPIYIFMILILSIFLIPIIFIKYYYMPMRKFVPEMGMFVKARKAFNPLIQNWFPNGYFEFKPATSEDLKEIKEKELPKSYTVRGLEIYQKLLPSNEIKNVYKEAFQNISSNFIVTDIQSFRQMIEILKKNKTDFILKLIIVSGIALFIVLIGLGVYLKLKG